MQLHFYHPNKIKQYYSVLNLSKQYHFQKEPKILLKFLPLYTKHLEAPIYIN